jgi:hypothetical protein
MADAFLHPTEEQPFVNHIDGDKTNNDLSNLEICSNSENVKHAYDNGLYDFKECHPIEVSGGDFLAPVQFKSIRQASEEMNINRKRITGILNEEIPNNTQYEFRYL